ncbi:hypothetical protein B296_00055073 [Ensete ventricosum]|uniref:Uncharacterized protein n=1 Tax=Ensete ventricosum TaxID=4639 RepID=A0A426XSD7_ENSVE|nr:hypothetical protein B296_00055073 [Ensete ventricosum]
MAIEGCGSGTIVLMVAKEYNSSSTRLMVAEGCNSGTTRLMVAEGCNSGTNGLMVVKGCNSGTIGLMVAEGCDSDTTGLMVAEGCNSSTTGLMAAKGMPQEYMLVDHACPARGYLGLRRLHVCKFTLQTVACRTGNSGNSRSSSFAPLIPLIRSDVLSGSSSVKVVPSANSEGTQSEGPKASVSGSLCSRIPSRQTPSYKEILRGPSGVRFQTRRLLVDPEVGQGSASKFGQGVLHPNLAKDLYTLPSEILMTQAKKQIVAVATVRQQADELQANNANLRSGLDELTNRVKQVDKELNELRAGLAESQMKE